MDPMAMGKTTPLRSCVFLLCLVATGSCAGVDHFTFKPVSDAHQRSEWRRGGEGSFLEYYSYYWQQRLHDDATLYVVLSGTAETSLTVRLRLDIAGDTKVSLASPVLTLRTNGSDQSIVLESFRLSVYGQAGEPGHFIDKAPTAALEIQPITFAREAEKSRFELN
jgi:hypothetical protein